MVKTLIGIALMTVSLALTTYNQNTQAQSPAELSMPQLEKEPSASSAEEAPAAPSIEDISPPEGNGRAQAVVGLYEFADNLPGEFETAMYLANMSGVVYDNGKITVTVEAGELFLEDDDAYFYSTTVTVFNEDFVGGLEPSTLVVSFDKQESCAMVVVAGENGFTKGLTDFLCALMTHGGENVDAAKSWYEQLYP